MLSHHQTDPSEHRISVANVSTAKFLWAALSSSHEQPLAQCHGPVRDAQTMHLHCTSAAEKTTMRHRAWTPVFDMSCPAPANPYAWPGDRQLSQLPGQAPWLQIQLIITKKISSITSTGLMNKIRYSSKSTFSPHNCTYINILLVLKKKKVKKLHSTCSCCPCVPHHPGTATPPAHSSCAECQ